MSEHLLLILKIIKLPMLLGLLLLAAAWEIERHKKMNWLINAVVIFVVVLLANFLNATFHLLPGLWNLFFWALVLALFVGVVSVRNYPTVR